MNNFDTQPLLSEINTIIKNGVQDIVKDYMKRHTLLEQTHDTIVNLPSVKEHYANKIECDSDPYKDVKIKLEPGVEYVTKEETLKLIKNLDNKLNDFVKINNELFNKLLIEINELKLEIIKHSDSTTRIEKENIKLEIVDEIVNECKINENDGEVESNIEELVVDLEEEEEAEEEEAEEEQDLEEETEEVVSVETETKEEEDDDEEELIEIEIDDVTYCTNNEENGIIYELDKEGNVGKRLGCLKEGDAYFD